MTTSTLSVISLPCSYSTKSGGSFKMHITIVQYVSMAFNCRYLTCTTSSGTEGYMCGTEMSRSSSSFVIDNDREKVSKEGWVTG